MKFKNKPTLMFVVFLVLLGGGIVVIKWQANRQANTKVPVSSASDLDTDQVDDSDFVLVQTGDEVKQVSLLTGKFRAAISADSLNLANFSGLPKATEASEVESSIKVVSRDKSKIIVSSEVYENKHVDQANPLISRQDYVCDVLKQECSQTQLLSQAYQGLDAKIQADNLLWLSGWDSENNVIYAHLTGQAGNDISPVWACNSENKICTKTDGYDSLIKGQTAAVVSQGAFSPSLGKFIMIAQHDQPNLETGKQWDLLLYASDDLSQPQKIYNISEAIDESDDVAYDSVQSVAWNEQEDKIYFGTTRKIFGFDFATGKVNLLYTAPGNYEGGLYWDNGTLEVSKNGQYLAFVEFLDNPNQVESEDEDVEVLPEIGILKKIDLNNNSISEVVRQPDLTLDNL